MSFQDRILLQLRQEDSDKLDKLRRSYKIKTKTGMIRALILSTPLYNEKKKQNETIEKLKNNLIGLADKNLFLQRLCLKLVNFVIWYSRKEKEKVVQDMIKYDGEFTDLSAALFENVKN